MAANIGKKWAVALPPYHEKLFLCWAYCKGVSKTNLSQNLIQARTEANEPQILEMVDERAKAWGCSRDDAMDRILDEMGFEEGDEAE